MPTSTPSMRSRREGGGSLISAALLERELTFTISQRGEHWVSNALAVLAAVEAVGADVALAGLALADLGGLKGRGERHRIALDGGEVLLIDESYNANPASMAATLKSLGAEKRRARAGSPCSARCASSASTATRSTPGLAPAVRRRACRPADPDRRGDAAAGRARGRRHRRSSASRASRKRPTRCCAMLRPGDAVLVKARNSIGLAKLVERVVKGTGMLYVIAEQLGFPGILNLIRYISFRAGAASATALLIGLLLGPEVHQLAARHARARASRSAPTARRATSPSAARRPWAAC